MKCPICEIKFSDINSNDTIYSTICGHVMHKDCLVTWLKVNSSCPICRKHCTESNMFQLFLSPNFEEDQDQCATLSAIQRLESIFCASSSAVNQKFDEISNKFGNFSLAFSAKEENNKKLVRENENLRDQIRALQENLDIEKFNLQQLRGAYAELREELEQKIQNNESGIRNKKEEQPKKLVMTNLIKRLESSKNTAAAEVGTTETSQMSPSKTSLKSKKSSTSFQATQSPGTVRLPGKLPTTPRFLVQNPESTAKIGTSEGKLSARRSDSVFYEIKMCELERVEKILKLRVQEKKLQRKNLPSKRKRGSIIQIDDSDSDDEMELPQKKSLVG